MIGMPVCEVKQDFAYRYFRFRSAIGCFLGEGMQFTYNPPDILSLNIPHDSVKIQSRVLSKNSVESGLE